LQDGPLPGVTIIVCLWSILVFLGLNIQGGHADLHRWGYYSETDIYRGSYWALVTMAFCHVQVLHLLFNLFWTWAIGSAFEKAIGSLPLAVFVLTSAFVSSGLQLGTEGLGIGLSGVGFGLFGFGWVARVRYPEFARVVNNNTIQTFLIWFAICVFTTYTHIMNIANVAHLTGLLFGLAVGAVVVKPRYRIAAGTGLVVLSALSVVPLFWNPLSFDWVAEKAYTLSHSGDYEGAKYYFQRAVKMGKDDKWSLDGLARIYWIEGDKVHYKETVDRLRVLSPDAASKLDSE
jgi:GlpG protein